MKYRTKLTLLLVALALVSNGVLVMISYRLTRRLVINEMNSKVLSIAATASSFIDGDLHKQIRTRDDEHSEAYHTLAGQLRQVRDINQDIDVQLRYVYTMTGLPGVPSGAAFGVDAQEYGTEGWSHVGEPVGSLKDDVDRLAIDDYNVEPFYEDEFGVWFSASAPVRDRNGTAVASLGVDLDVRDVMKRTDQVFWNGLVAMAVASVVALGLSLFLSKRVTEPLDQLSRSVRRFGRGQLDTQAKVLTRDEFGDLARGFNQMTADLKRHIRQLAQEHAANEKIKWDLEMAHDIQRRLLPVHKPDLAGFEIAGWSLAADEAGGDYFDWMTLPDGRVVVSIADASGHGIGPALVATACRTYIRALTDSDLALEGSITRLNDMLVTDLPSGRFVTAAVGLLDPHRRAMRLLSAGHGPILFYEAESGQLHVTPADTFPLGIVPGAVFPEPREIVFRSGDTLVLVTDGFFEWANPDGELFGIQRLGQVIRDQHDLAPQQLITALHQEVLAFAQGGRQTDDITVVVVKHQ